MDMIWQATYDGYVKLLYENDPQGPLLESIQEFEKQFIKVAQENQGNPDVAGVLKQTGLQDIYNRLYMASINRNNDYQHLSAEEQIPVFDYQKEQRLPTVHEFLNNYRLVYEEVRPNARKATNEAYEKLFAIENRTSDLIEAQMIIEKEKLILNTVIADYKELAEDFLQAADPNFEITSSVVKVSAGTYAKANSLDEITYMGEIARGKAEDLAVQNQIKMDMMVQFMSLIFTWEHAKRKVRQGGPFIGGYAKSMVSTREKIRSYYQFMSQDMGIDFDTIEKTPFYRIMLLNPKGLDELWRIKKVMHPDNIKATKYVLFEEILTDRSMEDILLTAQKIPYYESLDTLHDVSGLDDEYLAIANELNKDIAYFRRNKTDAEYLKQKREFSSKELLKNMHQLNNKFSEGVNKETSKSSASQSKSTLENVTSALKNTTIDNKKEILKDVTKDVATSTIRGFLRGFFGK